MTPTLPKPVASALAITLALTAFAAASEPARVRLTSGRQLAGEVSPRSSGERLWLVQRSGAAEIARPIAWDHIVAAEFRGLSLTSRELRSLIVSTAAPVAARTASQQADPRDAQQNPFQEDPQASEELPLPVVQAPSPTIVDRATFLALTTPPVASVRLDAHLANWDADVEADGLAVQIVPVDQHGQVVPVRGALQVELFGVRAVAFQDAPHKRGRSYERLGYWTQQLVPQYIQSDGGWFKLPFQALHPEYDPRVGYLGLVHVKLVVPGAGVFEDSLDGIRLREFAPLRDGLQRDTGRRFFPSETTGRGERSW